MYREVMPPSLKPWVRNLLVFGAIAALSFGHVAAIALMLRMV